MPRHIDAESIVDFWREFGLPDSAFQNLLDGERVKARDAVHEQIHSHVPEMLAYSGQSKGVQRQGDWGQ